MRNGQKAYCTIFYAPSIHAKLDLIPEHMTYFWFNPTLLGTFGIACTECCGIGCYNMRGEIAVDQLTTYQVWLPLQRTLGFAALW